MADEIVTASQSSQTRTPFGSISILVVDDDATCLAIVAAILKSWKYEVVTVKHAMDALCALRINGGSFDLVVTDVHMPDMNGFELQKRINEEFNLPVVLMSVDDKDSVILKGLQSGAAFFIVKPISPGDLKNLWQYAVAKKKGKAIIEETGNVQEALQADKACNEDILVQETSHADKGSNEEIDSASSVNEDGQSIKDNNADEGENKDNSSTPKKAKVVWTNALHNQFLEAIRSIGLERAVPKKILELMNVPGLTRENVASHLQKYRIFLKRVSDASYKIQSAAERSMVERTLRSNFALGQPSLVYNKCGLRYIQPLEQKQVRTSFQQRHGGHVPVVESPNFGHPSSSNQEVSSSNSIRRFGSGQSHLLYNQGNLQQPMNSSEKPHYQVNPSSFKMEANNHRTGLSFHGNTSGGLMSGTNFVRMYEQKAQVAPKSFNSGLSKCNSITSGVTGPNGITNYRKMGAFDNSNLNFNRNYNSNNYAGYRMAGDGLLVGLGYMGYMGAEASTDFNSNNGLISGMQNGNMSSVPVSSGNSGDHLTQVVSSSAGLESAIHTSPPFFNAIKKENTSVPPLAPTPLQQNSFSNGGESEYTFGMLNNFSDSNSNSFMQPYGEGDLSLTFLNQINIQPPTQQDGAEAISSAFSFGSYHVEDNPLVNKQSLGQQPDGEVMVSNFGIGGSQTDVNFPSFEQNPSQQDDEEFLESIFGPGEYGGDDNTGGL